ncbi:MAG: Prolipoprotein diacylglyceryl transferase [Candidatus Ozemobacter sibiricus]|jgi:phosphatidylglycerol:prolipoprotein diacylglycerol transferase|uniref:Phosphatidylglycerol--prolipoprotein diacylglyceryl transferase n=1 Tax=Candidatus Ozemobacter sibiricus TaxID=2268124 RepID=A0A367ZMJ1_9BACT|nr:MAG: Prolipoprotein diacylglyceryl transferase [Candidatus Ozemobacter sibiricus]
MVPGMYPILFAWGPIRIGSYGVLLALAFGAAIIITNREFRRQGLDTLLAWDIYLLAILGGLVGSRGLYILEHFGAFLRDPGPFLISATGFSVIGGYLLAIALCWIRVHREGQPFLKIADLCAPGMAVGYAIGRLGCIAAGDGCYGLPTLAWCGMTFPHGLVPTLSHQNPLLTRLFMQRFPGTPVPDDIPVHPTPLYESISAFILLAILLAGRWTIGPGRRLAFFLAWFGISRFGVEFIRLNPVVWWGLTSDQLLSVGWVALSLLVLWIGRNQLPLAPEPTPGSPAQNGTERPLAHAAPPPADGARAGPAASSLPADPLPPGGTTR